MGGSPRRDKPAPDRHGIGEIDAVLFQVDRPFALMPLEFVV